MSKSLCNVQCDSILYLYCVAAGDRGLEVRGDGGGSPVPVGLFDRMCGGNAGFVPAAGVPKALHSTSAAQLGSYPHVKLQPADQGQHSHSQRVCCTCVCVGIITCMGT